MSTRNPIKQTFEESECIEKAAKALPLDHLHKFLVHETDSSAAILPELFNQLFILTGYEGYADHLVVSQAKKNTYARKRRRNTSSIHNGSSQKVPKKQYDIKLEDISEIMKKYDRAESRKALRDTA